MKKHIRTASIFFGLLLASTASATSAELIEPRTVGQALTQHGENWKTAIEHSEKILFYTDTEWPAIAKSVENIAPERERYRERFFAEADRLLTQPIPVYRTPEEIAASGDAPSLYSAREELWQRDVGNQIVGYSFALRLRPDNAAYSARLHDLVMAAISYRSWGQSLSDMGNNADLAAGHIARGIALAYDWHRGIFAGHELWKIRQVIAQRLPCLLRGLYGSAFWAKGYDENHNHVSVTALAYCGIAFYDELPSAPIWLAAARENFLHVAREMAADGSSVEGVSYWTYGMEYILQYIEGTRPAIDSELLYERPFLQNAASSRLMATTPGLGSNLPWGDAVLRDWTGAHHILFRLAGIYNDSNAAWLAENMAYPLNGSLDQLALQMIWASQAPDAGATPEQLDHRLTVNDMVTTRSGWTNEDYLLSIKAGYTNRNHSHLDAGAIAFAFGNEWLITAPGYGKGASESEFWQRDGPRWEFFSNATESHSTLLINGKNQSHAPSAKAIITSFLSAPDWNWTSVDLSDVYENVEEVQREILHKRNDYFLIFDYVKAANKVSVEWLAHFRSVPKALTDGSFRAESESGDLLVHMLQPAQILTPRKPSKEKVDMRLTRHNGYSAEQSGNELSFVTLLQPAKAKNEVTPLKITTFEEGPSRSYLSVAGTDWVDYIGWSHQASKWTIKANNSMPEIGLLEADAKGLIIRDREGTAATIIALQATRIEFDGFSYTTDNPSDLNIQMTAQGNWTVSEM